MKQNKWLSNIMLYKKNPDTKKDILYDSTAGKNQDSGHLGGGGWWELTEKGHEGTFWGDELSYILMGYSYIGIHNYKHSSLKSILYNEFQLYLN